MPSFDGYPSNEGIIKLSRQGAHGEPYRVTNTLAKFLRAAETKLYSTAFMV